MDLARGRAQGEFAPLTDGDPDTWWASPGDTAEIVIELGQEAAIGGIRIEEAIQFGQRVEGFAVDVRAWSGWYEHMRGTTIGAQRITALKPASGNAVRIRILSSQAPPVLARVMVYAA